MSTDSVCQYLEWDSDFFGRRIARITVNQLTPQTMARALAWCSAKQIDCLYFLAASDDAATMRLAEEHLFRFVDIRVTLERTLGEGPITEHRASEATVGPCGAEDVEALKAMARTSHRYSRFYYDLNFGEGRCDALYETWIEKSCRGYANVVLVAKLKGKVVGYICCDLLAPEEGRVALFAVGAEAQGQGVGEKLLKESFRWFENKGVKRLMVVTQGRNCKAQRLYQRCGFVTRLVQLWYHRWFRRGGGEG
jgi:dTDP-4-amino-4,6-dideoxy-D-galactose acyltransferase